jgi:SAM-dependent methyltransferase
MDRFAGWGSLEMGAEQALALAHGMAVAEIGCGPGPALRRLADAVGASGTIYEVDVDPNALAFIERRRARIASLNGKPLPRVVTVLSSFTDVGLAPGSIDRAYLQEVHNYALLPHAATPALARARYEAEQGAWTRSVHAALRPGGRLVIREMLPEVNRGAAYGPAETVAFVEGTGLFRQLALESQNDTRHYLLAFQRIDPTPGAGGSSAEPR